MNILAIIPARGQSKGLPGKNIKLLADKPLIAYTIEAALESKFINRTIVSTDDFETMDIAKNFGAEVPFLRPDYLALDTTTTVEVVLDLLANLKATEDYVPDYVCLLQCTSPLRNSVDIDACIIQCLNSDFDACYSVSEAKSSPYWMKVFDGPKLTPFINSDTILRRQDLPKVYSLNGAIYFVKTSELLKYSTLHLPNATGYIMPRNRSVDIDTDIDFELAQILAKKGSL